MNKEALKNSILLIGPMGVGKSLIGKMLSTKIGFDLIDQDGLSDYLIDYYNEEVYSTGLIGMFIQDMHYKKQSNRIMNGAKLTKEQKRARKSYLHSLYRGQGHYSKLCGGFENLTNRVNEYRLSSMGIDKYSYDMKLLNEQDFLIDISLSLLNNIKKPIIFDASGLCFMDLSKKLEDLTKEECDCYSEEKIKAVIEKIKQTASMFGTVVFFEPTDYYHASVSKEIAYGSIQQLLLNHLDGYKSLSNYIIRPRDLFFDYKNEAFNTRHPLDIIKAEKRQKLVNHKEVDRICSEIFSARESLLTEPGND